MRKLILISAFVSASILASVSAQAGESRNLVLAANEEPKSVDSQPSDEATAKPQASPKQASRSNTRIARRESDEQKARRIAAKYGVYW